MGDTEQKRIFPLRRKQKKKRLNKIFKPEGNGISLLSGFYFCLWRINCNFFKFYLFYTKIIPKNIARKVKVC